MKFSIQATAAKRPRFNDDQAIEVQNSRGGQDLGTRAQAKR